MYCNNDFPSSRLLVTGVADNVLPAPVPDKLQKQGSLLILYAAYFCMILGGSRNAYPFGTSRLSIPSYSDRNVSTTLSWNFLPVLPCDLTVFTVVPFFSS